MSFYEKRRPLIKNLDHHKVLDAIEVCGLVDIKTNDEVGKLLWESMKEDIEDVEYYDLLRNLWLDSNIDMEDLRTKTKAMKIIIKVKGKCDKKDFIRKIWMLKVCMLLYRFIN